MVGCGPAILILGYTEFANRAEALPQKSGGSWLPL
jgi:hypothetical protein